MTIDDYGQIKISEEEFMNLLYSGNFQYDNLYLDNSSKIDQFNRSNKINFTNLPELKKLTEPTVSLKEFDQLNQNIWFIPEEYQKLDIEKFLFDRCQTDIEIERVKTELELFKKYSMINVLKFLKFLVDTIKENNIIKGIGRGSSVASYCLYLLEVHKVNSIKYELDINEFLK